MLSVASLFVFHKGQNIVRGDRSLSFIRLKPFLVKTDILLRSFSSTTFFWKDQKQKNIQDRGAAGSDIKEARQRL